MKALEKSAQRGRKAIESSHTRNKDRWTETNSRSSRWRKDRCKTAAPQEVRKDEGEVLRLETDPRVQDSKDILRRRLG